MSRFRGGARPRPQGRPRRRRGRPFIQEGVTTAQRAAALAGAEKSVELPESCNVGELAEQLGVPAAQVITVLLKHKVIATINRQLDYDTARMVAEELGFTVAEQEEEDEVAEAS